MSQVARDLFGGLSGRRNAPLRQTTANAPLIVAIHGGTYTSAYFDIPGYSLLDRATALGIPAIAPDRHGYGHSKPLPDGEGTIKDQARALKLALPDAWKRYRAKARGIVLIGHSIGGAIAATIASDPDGLPIIGLAVSGVGLKTPGDHQGMWERLPKTPMVEMPMPVKDQLMFSPPGAFDATMPGASHKANAPCPRAELLDIVGGWQSEVHETLGRITVPLHYRQAENDLLWVVSDSEIAGFASAASKAKRVDAQMMRATGHCMDFHLIGGALQVQQLGFALQCGAEQT